MSASKPAIVCIVAHPDDVTFMMGGTALLLQEKYKLHVIVASRGEKGYHREGKGPTPPNADVAAIRCAEEAAACAMFGAELEFLDQPDGDLHAHEAVCKTIAEKLQALKPVALFTHWPCSKPDHAAVWNIAWKALHVANLFWEVETYMCLMSGDDRNVPKPDVYVNISAVFEQKLKMIALHKSHAEAWTKILTDYNSALGKQIWCEKAEAFAAGLPPVATRWNRKAGSILMDLAK